MRTNLQQMRFVDQNISNSVIFSELIQPSTMINKCICQHVDISYWTCRGKFTLLSHCDGCLEFSWSTAQILEKQRT